jgi:hypothetical protein
MWSSWWYESWQRKLIYSEKTYPSATFPPHIPHKLTLHRTRAVTVWGMIPSVIVSPLPQLRYVYDRWLRKLAHIIIRRPYSLDANGIMTPLIVLWNPSCPQSIYPKYAAMLCFRQTNVSGQYLRYGRFWVARPLKLEKYETWLSVLCSI